MMNNMKKLYIYAFALMVTMVAFTSCNDDEDQLTDSRLTYYPEYTIKGDEFVIHPIGEPYVDPGCTAMLQGEDYTSHIETTGLEKLDINTPGLYYITYGSYNKDHYWTSVMRTVAVCDTNVTTDLTGDYKVIKGYRENKGNQISFTNFKEKLEKVAPGIFKISDLLGGWYDQRAGYGSNYAMPGYIQLTIDNKINVLSGHVPAWGDTYNSVTSGTYDPENQTLDWSVNYSEYSFIFYVQIQKQKKN